MGDGGDGEIGFAFFLGVESGDRSLTSGLLALDVGSASMIAGMRIMRP